MKRKGFLVTIAAPSGGGKSSICSEILRLNPDIRYSVSWTTRPLRGKEKNGIDYIFTDISTFQKKIEEGFFLEYALVHGNYYGTSKSFVDDCLFEEKIVIFDIDVQGVELIKNKGYDVVTIFILPPNQEVLRQRLMNRGTDSLDVIKQRLENAKKEIDYIQNYDYLVINDDLNRAIELVNSILIGEKNRINRYISPIEDFYL